LDSSEEESLRNTIEELTHCNEQRMAERRVILEPIQINSPSPSLRCRIKSQDVDVLYNPTVGANAISDEFALALFGGEIHTLTDRKLKRFS